jgi:hypothetical protein
MFNEKFQIDEEVFEDFVQKAALLLLQDEPVLARDQVRDKLLEGMKKRQQFQELSRDVVGYDITRLVPIEDIIGAGVWDALERLVEKCVEHAYKQFMVDYYAEMQIVTGMVPVEVLNSEYGEQIAAAVFVKRTARNIIVHNHIESLADIKRIVKEEFIKKYSGEFYEEMNSAGRAGYRIDFDLETMHMMHMASVETGRIKDAFRRYNFGDKA